MGAVTAERLAELGATVVVLGRRKERLDSLVKNIEAADGTALALAVDVTDRDAVQTAADQIRSPSASARPTWCSTTPVCNSSPTSRS
ncbi:SDR family NAD(P)-dependent oxidoreductase [Streptomyces sp. NPDC050548]|uniref:SDR family NAD(P)-dependent oxidoreductase n=1 Tax=Streptomyces sp. NPDC050548 TaxID=3365629 RepID=UPI00378EC205